jgi:hypothetical protein
LAGGKAQQGQVQQWQLDPWAGLFLSLGPEPAK